MASPLSPPTVAGLDEELSRWEGEEKLLRRFQKEASNNDDDDTNDGDGRRMMVEWTKWIRNT